MWTLQKKIKELTNGELTIKLIGGAEVIAAIDQPTAVKKGVVDMTQLFSAGYRGLVSVVGVLPLSKISPREERQNGFYDFLLEQHLKAGVYYLGRAPLNEGPTIFNMWVKKKINRPQDIAGMKIGGGTPASAAFIKELGGVPITIPTAESYTALQSGVIDGYWNSLITFFGMKLYELPLYMIDHPYYRDNMTFIMNPDTFNGLPKHLQSALVQAITAVEEEVPVMLRAELERDRKIMLDAGVGLITFTPADVKWFIDTAYQAEWANQLNQDQVLTQKARSLLEK
ncbi:MAG: TRAP transporter substrate-binding protein DctP [Chloroflexi bacterium]|nr:TRAP transporter substrate-binding protein DctP [Chloroflexota bacterium]